MKETLIIGGWWVLFGATHLLLSSARVRPKLVTRWGERPFRAVYALIALATFMPLCMYYAEHKHVGPQLWVTLEPYLLARDLNIAGMLLAFILLLGGVLDRPSQGTPRAYGMTRITRHPFFAAAFLFGLAHLAVIGALGDLIFFGGFVVFAWVGAKHLDQRKSRDVPGYPAFQDATSFVPFAAIVSKKQPFPGRELRWGAIVVALILFYVVRFYHPALFGGVLMTL